MICRKCGRKSEGRYCSYCGAPLSKAGRIDSSPADEFSGIDFVPEDEKWSLDTGEGTWEEIKDNDQDLDETVVLEPLDMYEPGEQRRIYQPEEQRQTYQSGEQRQVYQPEARNTVESERWGESEKWDEEEQIWNEKEPSERKYGKYGRDPYDVPEETPRTRKTVYEEEVVRKKKKKKGKAASSVKSVGRTAGKTVGKAVGGTAGRVLPFVLRLVSLASMGIIVIRLFFGLWAQKDSLGAAGQVIAERNYAEAFYLVLSVCLLAYGAFSMLWILTRRRMASEGRLRRFDTGRGLAAFVIFALLAFASARLALYLPEAPHVLSGLGQFLLVVASLQSTVYMCSIVGIVCCIIRKITKY